MTTPSVDAIVTRLAARSISWDRMRRRIAAALACERPEHEAECHMGPYVAVARQRGAGGIELARRVGAALGWPVLDREVVDLVAAHLHVNPSMMDLLDQDAANWVTDVLGDLMPHAVITRDTYTHELRRVLQLLAVHGEVVFLGRDANFFLPHERGLAVRVVAAIGDRIARVRARGGLDETRALDEIKDADRARAHAVSHAFDCDVEDPLYYDLVVNSSRRPIEELADVVVGLCRTRWPHREPDLAGTPGSG
ncbi:MAG: cytidylate kinase-like family protein [Thermoanaerobaculaceae bacterium]|nr:cytidylate kinase-like family protein [Thermoanaerobaculaceae bacterium]TAM46004.1 MAG: cytidylate kinase-like family protein [Acidobacteriota bacterium]